MLNWCTEHPWMTFFIIIVVGLDVIGTALKYLICGIFKIKIVVKDEDNNSED